MCALRFNTVGDQQDFRFILSRIRNRFPAHRMYGVGISAGSSLLARYLGGTPTPCFNLHFNPLLQPYFNPPQPPSTPF